ncbi:MAG TPA: galactosyldiacylglycerol synthase, partial [Ktedonobacteraceae bacterium]|nr:galactosyldiacylglycerol synthase [Ktedonobacteraceae bacterium]
MGPQRTILFLIADTGAGHRSAANAIKNAIIFLAQKRQEEQLLLEQASEAGSKAVSVQAGYRIEIVDVFEEYSRFPLREAVKL